MVPFSSELSWVGSCRITAAKDLETCTTLFLSSERAVLAQHVVTELHILVILSLAGLKTSFTSLCIS